MEFYTLLMFITLYAARFFIYHTNTYINSISLCVDEWMLPEWASKIQNWIDWKDWNFLKIWPPRCSFQKLTCLNLEFWLCLLASSQLAFLLLCRSQFIFYFNMSILLALNCQFMQSSFFVMHFLGGCLLCWCPFRAYILL